MHATGETVSLWMGTAHFSCDRTLGATLSHAYSHFNKADLWLTAVKWPHSIQRTFFFETSLSLRHRWLCLLDIFTGILQIKRDSK